MGNLTTFTIYNDGVYLIKEDCKEFCEKLYNAALSDEASHFGHGNHANLVRVQKTRHADNNTVYVHMGNTVTEMSPFSKETKRLMHEFPNFFENMLIEMEYTVEELRKEFTLLKKAKGVKTDNDY